MAERFIVYQQTSLTKKSTQLRALANNARSAVEDVLLEIAHEIVEDAISNYESAIPGETYVRTGDLGRGWEIANNVVEHSDGSISVEITNKVVERKNPHRHYAALVQGDLRTGRHNDAGWLTIDEIRQFHSHEQTNKVRAALRKAARS